jgi:hypothetical protein
VQRTIKIAVACKPGISFDNLFTKDQSAPDILLIPYQKGGLGSYSSRINICE